MKVPSLPVHQSSIKMPDAPAQTSQIFDNAAAAYEASTGGCTRDLARHMLALAPPITPGSVIHDNACGTGVVAQEILTRDILSQSSPKHSHALAIHCTDKSEKMVHLAQSWFENKKAATNIQTVFPGVRVDFEAAPSENLPFKNELFTHSFTNCGILWFDDGLTAAREILRTLKSGGTAVVSSWKEMNIFDIAKEAQRACGQQEPLFRPPVDEKWFDAGHLDSVLREAGFEDVRVVERAVHFGGKDVGEVCGHLMGLLGQLFQGWGADEEFSRQLETVVGNRVVRFDRLVAEGAKELVGIPMVALVAVGSKK
jgi:ubiquinone/menaquinone biosynthesis C-methylase UbiE